MDLEQCLDDLVARIQAENAELMEAEQLRKQEELNEAMTDWLEIINAQLGK